MDYLAEEFHLRLKNGLFYISVSFLANKDVYFVPFGSHNLNHPLTRATRN